MDLDPRLMAERLLASRPFGDETVEEQLRDAVYTLVGVGVLAYKYSEPYRRRAGEAVRQVIEDDFLNQDERSRQ